MKKRQEKQKTTKQQIPNAQQDEQVFRAARRCVRGKLWKMQRETQHNCAPLSDRNSPALRCALAALDPQRTI